MSWTPQALYGEPMVGVSGRSVRGLVIGSGRDGAPLLSGAGAAAAGRTSGASTLIGVAAAPFEVRDGIGDWAAPGFSLMA